jgi:hypothetical protein
MLSAMRQARDNCAMIFSPLPAPQLLPQLARGWEIGRGGFRQAPGNSRQASPRL